MSSFSDAHSNSSQSSNLSLGGSSNSNMENYVIAIGATGIERYTEADFYGNKSRSHHLKNSDRSDTSSCESRISSLTPLKSSTSRLLKETLKSKVIRDNSSSMVPRGRSASQLGKKVYPVSGPIPFISYIRNPPHMNRQPGGTSRYVRNYDSKKHITEGYIDRKNSADSSVLELSLDIGTNVNEDIKPPANMLLQPNALSKFDSMKRLKMGSGSGFVTSPRENIDELGTDSRSPIRKNSFIASSIDMTVKNDENQNYSDVQDIMIDHSGENGNGEGQKSNTTTVFDIEGCIQVESDSDTNVEYSYHTPRFRRYKARSNSPRRQSLKIDTRKMCKSVHSSKTPANRHHHKELSEPDIIKKLNSMHDPKVRSIAASKFNNRPKDCIQYLVEEGVIKENPQEVSEYLRHESGLSKRKLGEYFSNCNTFNQDVFKCFLSQLDFKGLSLDEALRKMVFCFRMPGEAQQIDRIMEYFAKCWYYDNDADCFSCVDTAYVLSFSLMILNTDLYNRNLKESEKMTVDQFCNNNRGIDNGNDLPRSLLEGMYNRVKANEIRMDEGDMFESEIITFVGPKISGWLKKKSNSVVGAWKRHWFVLIDGVLYYFSAPQDKAPRCIIPLIHIKIEPIGETDISVCAIEGHVKSVKKREGGRMEQGNHKEFVLRAENELERDKWIKALHSEAASTGIGSPGMISSRKSKSGGNIRRHSSFEKQVNIKLPLPSIRGWAKTQSGEGPCRSRRYCAIFQQVEQPSSPFSAPSSGMFTSPGSSDLGSSCDQTMDVLYFFGSSNMCDRMVEQNLHTSHGRINLQDVFRIEIWNLLDKVRPKTIILHVGSSSTALESFSLHDNSTLSEEASTFSQFKSHSDSFSTTSVMLNVSNAKKWIFVPEDRFDNWVGAFMTSCPNSGTPISMDPPYDPDDQYMSPQENSSNYSGSGSPSRSHRFSVTSSISSSKNSPKKSIFSNSHSKNFSIGRNLL